ncbi:hypothetical protein KY306_03505 [Candidatus Woesearchaeota archaeon]|nr:hypothetical protein [Candidatus Woesearchaeota archaeon]
MPTATMNIVESLGDLIELVNEIRIEFGGTHKLNTAKLNGVYNTLREIHGEAKADAPPVFARKIAEAQAAITFIKSKKDVKDIESLFLKLIQHLNTAIALLGTKKPVRKAA